MVGGRGWAARARGEHLTRGNGQRGNGTRDVSPKRYADVFTLAPENVALFNTRVAVNCVPKKVS